jgi:hypothetical protein
MTAISDATAHGHEDIVNQLVYQTKRTPPPPPKPAKPVKPVRKDGRGGEGGTAKEQDKADPPKVYPGVIASDTPSAHTPHHHIVTSNTVCSTVDGDRKNKVQEGKGEHNNNQTHTQEVSHAPRLFVLCINRNTMHYSLSCRHRNNLPNGNAGSVVS